VSNVHWTVLGEHCAPVRSVVAADEVTSTLFFSRATALTARATEEFGKSTSMSTPPVSHHWRAIEAPISGLFW
jgi:hypothetical protein